MGLLAILMIAIWITVAYEKPHAFIFAISVLAVGLVTRYLVQHRAEVRKWVLRELGVPVKEAVPQPVLPGRLCSRPSPLRPHRK